MNSTKGALFSTGVWGGLLALVPVLDQALSLFGVLPAGVIPDAANLVVGFLGSLLAIRGRIKAETKISGLL